MKDSQNMSGLAIVLFFLLVIAYFVVSMDILRAYETSEKTIRLDAIPTTSQQNETDEKVRSQWFVDFDELLKESQIDSDDN
jgi:hypothetical protein